MSIATSRRIAASVIASGAMVATVAAGAATAAPGEGRKAADKGGFTLTVLHANDTESALLPITRTYGSGEDAVIAEVAGAAMFTELLQQQRDAAVTGPPAAPGTKRGVITIHGGDLYLPSAQLDASRQEGAPFYDALAFNAAGWDVSAIGNHDFDLGPEFFADFLAQVDQSTTFVAANLDFSGEPRLQAFVDDGTIVDATVVQERGERIGVIGLTTPELSSLTSSRNVAVDPDLAGIANAQAELLEKAGVNKIILVSHLQDIDNEIALAAELENIDVVVGAGGGEVMASAGDEILPGDTRNPDYSYPQMVTAADGADVPVVTTSGLYRYVGKLVVQFDRDGNVVSVDDLASRPIPVTSFGPDAVKPDARVLRTVEQPVAEFVESLQETVVATTEVPLDGTRASIRSKETNLGNLVTDALLSEGQRLAAENGVTPPQVAIQNGGGIRNDSVIPAGDLTLFDTYSVVPFPNFVSVAPALPVEAFVAAVEHGSVSAGSFAQVAGFSYTYDPAAPVGSRVQSLTLDDGTPVVAEGEIVYSGTISLASIDFLLRGQDGYTMFAGQPFTVLPSTQQAALTGYLVETLGGVVSAQQYPAVTTPTRIVPLS